MLFSKRWLVLLVVGIFTSISFVSAIDLVRTNNSATSITINVTSASNLYGYEVAFDYTGTPNSPTFAGFLGSTTSGMSTRGSIATVYESKQDGTNTGVTGSGGLFTLTFSGTVTLRYLLAVYGDGSSEYVYYNNSGSSGSSNATTSSSSGGGGGGGGSSTSTQTPVDLALVKISSNTPELAISTIAGKPFAREIKIKNSGTIPITLTVNYTGFKGFDSSSQHITVNALSDSTTPDENSGFLDISGNLTIAPGEEKTITLSFGAIDTGLVTGVVYFNAQGESVYSLPVVINTRSENFLFDSILTIAENSKVVRPGGTLTVQINLQEVAKKTDKVDVSAAYVIKDFYGAIFLDEKETFSLTASKDYEKKFIVPKDLPPGKYVLGLELTYPGEFATASAQFQVPPPFWSLNPTTILIVSSLAMAVIFVIVIIWAIVRRRKLSSRIKKK